MSEEEKSGAESSDQEPSAPAESPEAAEVAEKAEESVHEETQGPESGADEAAKPLNPAMLLAALSLILALGLSGAVYWLWHSRAGLDDALRSRVDATDKQLAELKAQLSAGLKGELAAQRKQLDDGLRSMRSTLAAQAKSLAELERRRGREQGEWDIAETEYFLTLANRRLAWVNDVGSAIAALRVADRRLQALNDTRLVPVRQAIAAELRALDALPRPDLTALAARLAKLQARVSALPMKPMARNGDKQKGEKAGEAPRPALGDWRAHLSSLRRVFTDLVQVRRIDEPARPLLSPEQVYFLRENLALKLETARLAMLRGDAGLYRESLATARAWLEEYFNPGAPEVAELALALDELAAARLIDTLPDISASLATLRKLTGRGAQP